MVTSGKCGGDLARLKCQKLSQSACSNPCPGNASETCGDAWVLQTLSYAAQQAEAQGRPRHAGRRLGGIEWSCPPVPVPVTALAPDLPPAEARRWLAGSWALDGALGCTTT